jgi:hypothetical protein
MIRTGIARHLYFRLMLNTLGQTPIQQSDKQRFNFRTDADTQGSPQGLAFQHGSGVGKRSSGGLPGLHGSVGGESFMANRHRTSGLMICMFLVTVLSGCASTPIRESTGEYVDDSAITARVKAAIFGEPSLKVLQVNVETFKREVQLSGFVDSAASAKKAGEIAGSVEGVKSVKNDLIVK